MWFKAASVFQFLEDFKTTPEELESTLEEKAYEPVNRRQLLSYGWVPPMGEDSEQLVHAASGFILLRARREERILPSSVIAEHMAERVQKLEKTLERKVRGKEKLEIRDNVVMELTPQAFTKSSYEQLLIMPQQGLMVVDTASAKRVDQCTSLLRETLGSLPVAPVQTEIGQAGLFTRWLKGTRQLPKDLIMGDECVLQDEDNIAGTVRCNKQDLTSEEIRALSTTGKHVQRLGLTLNDTVSFVLDDEFGFSKIKFEDTSPDDGSDVADLDARAIFDSNFSLMALEFATFFPRMIEIFGGYKPSTDP
jgi:recombination associated protein RdgC